MSNPSLNTSDQPQFLSVTALAALLGVDKAAISRKVTKLGDQIETRCDGPGKPKLINVAAYLDAAKQTTDAIRTLNGAQSAPDAAKDPILAKEQARRVAIQADLAQIELDKARGSLVPAADVQDAMARAAGEIVRGLEALPGRATELAAAIAKDGEPGARAALKEFVRELRERLAAAMTLLAQDAPEPDEA